MVFTPAMNPKLANLSNNLVMSEQTP